MIIAVIFLCGAVCGTAAAVFYMHRVIQSPRRIYTIQRLESELQLTPQQRETVRHELDDYAKYYQNIEEERQSVAEQGKRNILKVLTPEQQHLFNQIFQFPSAVPCEPIASADSRNQSV